MPTARIQAAQGAAFQDLPYRYICKVVTRLDMFSKRSGSAIHIGGGYFVTAAHNLHAKGAPGAWGSSAKLYLHNPATGKWDIREWVRLRLDQTFAIPSGYVDAATDAESNALDYAIIKTDLRTTGADRSQAGGSVVEEVKRTYLQPWNRKVMASMGRSGAPKWTIDVTAFGFPRRSWFPQFSRVRGILPNQAHVGDWGAAFRASIPSGMSGGAAIVTFPDAPSLPSQVFGLNVAETETGDIHGIARVLDPQVWAFLESRMSNMRAGLEPQPEARAPSAAPDDLQNNPASGPVESPPPALEARPDEPAEAPLAYEGPLLPDLEVPEKPSDEGREGEAGDINRAANIDVNKNERSGQDT
ncbi:MAG: serine protease [Neomegalonema sp.]|nr:serine protease [Neomegalonema sp.]